MRKHGRLDIFPTNFAEAISMELCNYAEQAKGDAA